MNNLNSLILEGTVSGDINFVECDDVTKNSICSFLISVERNYKGIDDEIKKDVSYFDVISYGNIAKICSTHAKDGRGLRIVGRLKQNYYTDSDGKKHSQIVVLAEHIEFKPNFKKD